MSSTPKARIAAALGAVEAPADLWSRVESALPAQARTAQPPVWRQRFLMAAALAALMSGGVLYLRAQQPGQTIPSGTSIAWAALAAHTHPETGLDDLTVDRYAINGAPLTVVSAINATRPAQQQRIETTESGALTVTEWTAAGRRWALVSDRKVHKQACGVCHRA